MRLRSCDPINGCGQLYKFTFDSCPHCGNPSEYSTPMGFDPTHWIYDIESYPMVFTLSAYHPATDTWVKFEISYRRNDVPILLDWLLGLTNDTAKQVGYNNVGYDYPIIHHILTETRINTTAATVYEKSLSIINTPWNKRFDNIIPEWDMLIPQIDLMKVHHFDNKNRRVSLKVLEFNMRSENIQDLPFKPGSLLQSDQVDDLITYNDFDVEKTFQFYKYSLDMIEFREELSEKFDKNLMSASDAKIGSELLIKEIGADKCFEWVDGKKTKIQSPRDFINLSHVIFPYIYFKNPEFNRILSYFRTKTISETKGVFTGLTCSFGGLEYAFGTGGLHASVHNKTFYSNHIDVIIDIDVGGYYPSVHAEPPGRAQRMRTPTGGNGGHCPLGQKIPDGHPKPVHRPSGAHRRTEERHPAPSGDWQTEVCWGL